MKGSPLEGSRRSIASFLLGCIVLAFVTFVCVRLHTRLAIVAVLYLLTIVIISLQCRFFVTLLCSVLAFLGLDYFFTSPVFSLAVTRPEDIAALFTFSTTALIVSALGSKVRKSSLALLPSEAKHLDELREALSDILSDADRASAVIARIRAVVENAPPQKSRLNINETIGEVIALARGELSRNRVLLQTRLANDLPPIMGDRIQLQQVILNLFINAIEAMSDRPRELLVSSEKVPGDIGKTRSSSCAEASEDEAKDQHVFGNAGELEDERQTPTCPT